MILFIGPFFIFKKIKIWLPISAYKTSSLVPLTLNMYHPISFILPNSFERRTDFYEFTDVRTNLSQNLKLSLHGFFGKSQMSSPKTLINYEARPTSQTRRSRFW